MRAEGRDVVSLLEGEPDLPPPPAVIRATVQAVRGGWTRYSESSGLPELKKLIARKLLKRNGIEVSEDNILVTNGAKQALYEALQALCGPGDEVLIPRPYWVTFPESVKLAGAKPVFADTRDGRLDVAALERAATRRTKAVLINTPNNPTGAVYPKAALAALASLARRRGFFIVSDEAYEDLVFDGARHVSVASLGDAFARTVTVQTFSKSFSMTGFRVGFLAGPREVVRAASRLHGHVTGNVCTFAQKGAVAACRVAGRELDRRRKLYQRRRDLAYSLASRLFDCAKPEGAFYLFADARRHLGARFKDSAALAAYLLEKAGVAVVPGSACGREGFLRLSFSAPEAALREGFARVKEALRP
ncbi:MAG: pyridoxal phosphate-dependent aminotransferase [Elusimicrobia bacterium]|nr:pyridoxal phosphate-dependent aminotransferase [Elusimicrobiota bacterium]